ncbi:MAG TPA: UDP-N-acetylglucosamine 2-epimerase (non-hydrolyzing) [Terriglobia bacterium]|jgi:UDP-N-acetylglucosamine 2-epimerase (non-hydrolysing)|nr:UDP-N-acetylglucosamine 2-epimerase (non-hydrolyzing) [Terriglobia bacterium]
MKILMVAGARPNFVKIAALIGEMRKHPEIHPVLVHTGQHCSNEMSGAFFSELDIPCPDYDLGVRPDGVRMQITEIIQGLADVMFRERPDVVLVVGDVNSTLAGALAAKGLGIPVAHVEAGLRSFDRRMPEEINRVITDGVSNMLFASEPSGVENLLREGRPPESIFLVGNVMIDTLKRALKRMRDIPLPTLESLSGPRGLPDRYAVLTLHRQGLVDDRALFGRVWSVLQWVGRKIPIIFPVHPRTQFRLREMGIEQAGGNSCQSATGIHMVPPLGYLEFLSLENRAAFVMTDSGGVQEETTALGVPCLTLRENTERPITVIEGTNTVTGLDPENICREVRRLLSGDTRQARVPSLWDGRAAERIVRVLLGHFEPERQMLSARSDVATTAYKDYAATMKGGWN